MKILALDTSGERLIACLYEPPKARSVALKAAKRQDLLLDKALQRFDLTGLDAIAVGVGPGRFTGIRIGVAFAVMLGKSLDVPVAGFRGLESLAIQRGGENVCAVLPNIRDEVFYRLSGEDRWGPRAEMEKAAKAAGAAVYEGPLKAETLARRAEALLKARQPLPTPQPYYLKPGNFERAAR